jgi:trigger factor
MAFDAVFEVFPEVKIGDLATAEIERASAQVSDEAIDRTLEILRKQRRSFAQRAQGAPAEDGDGVPFDGGKAEDFAFVIAEGQMLPEFETAVRGLKVGESKTFPLAFPADYHGKDVAGKTADFMVTVKKIEAAHLPEVNEQLAKSLGVEGGTVDGLRADIRKNLEREVKFRVLSRNKQAAMDALINTAELDLPNAAVQSEIERLVEGARAELKSRGLKDADKAPLPDDLFRAQAERRVRLGLVVAELVKTQELGATPEQIKAHVQELAASYEQPEDVVRWYMGDQKRLGEVEAIVLENNVTDFVLGKAKVNEKAVPFEELMGQG